MYEMLDIPSLLNSIFILICSVSLWQSLSEFTGKINHGDSITLAFHKTLLAFQWLTLIQLAFDLGDLTRTCPLPPPPSCLVGWWCQYSPSPAPFRASSGLMSRACRTLCGRQRWRAYLPRLSDQAGGSVVSSGDCVCSCILANLTKHPLKSSHIAKFCSQQSVSFWKEPYMCECFLEVLCRRYAF